MIACNDHTNFKNINNCFDYFQPKFIEKEYKFENFTIKLPNDWRYTKEERDSVNIYKFNSSNDSNQLTKNKNNSNTNKLDNSFNFSTYRNCVFKNNLIMIN